MDSYRTLDSLPLASVQDRLDNLVNALSLTDLMYLANRIKDRVHEIIQQEQEKPSEELAETA